MKIINRKARFDYQILDTIEAGIQLTGPEVKSIKGGRAKLEGSFVKIIDGEVFLVNASISPYRFARQEGYDPNRSRKLLLHKRQIISLETKMHGSNLTLIPLSCYTKRGVVKVQIGLAKGKRKYEKKQAKKRRDLEREVERELKERV
jgi:SsrA-binding protein